MKVKPWAVGLFLLLGFGLFTAILFVIGNRHRGFSKHIELYTEFANLGGLADGAKVRVSGFDAGELKKIEIPRNASGKFRLELQIDDKVRGMVRDDSIASIETEGIVGDKFVQIKKGTDQFPEIASGATLPSKEPFDIEALMQKSSGLVDDLHGTIGDVHVRANAALDSITRTVNDADGLIRVERPGIHRAVGNVNTLLSDLNDGKGSVGLLLKDPATRQQLQASVANAQQATESLDETLADFESRDLPAKAAATLDNATELTNQLNTTVKGAFAEDSMGQDASSNLRETFSNLNAATGNLADDTEALKHEFFFRGFFKKRGFYDLDDLSAPQYLEALKSHKTFGPRVWLDESGLFETDADGQLQLSERGRNQIDSKIAAIVDDLPRYLIVVEGYDQSGSPSDQFVVSRRSASLVRKYLELHYHLRRRDIGIVALRDQFPRGAQQQGSGAAIVLLTAK